MQKLTNLWKRMGEIVSKEEMGQPDYNLSSYYAETLLPEGFTEAALINAMNKRIAETPQNRELNEAESKLQVLNLLKEIKETKGLPPHLEELAEKTTQDILQSDTIDSLEKKSKFKQAFSKDLESSEANQKEFQKIIMPELKENVAEELTEYTMTGKLQVTKDFTHWEEDGKSGLLAKTIKSAIYSGGYLIFNLFCTGYFLWEMLFSDKALTWWYVSIVSVFLIIGYVIATRKIITLLTLRKKIYNTSLHNSQQARETLFMLKTQVLIEFQSK